MTPFDTARTRNNHDMAALVNSVFFLAIATYVLVNLCQQLGNLPQWHDSQHTHTHWLAASVVMYHCAIHLHSLVPCVRYPLCSVWHLHHQAG